MPSPVPENPRTAWPREALRSRKPVPDLSALPRQEADRAKARIDELDRACGCEIGATLAFGALAAYVAGAALWFGRLAESTWLTVALGIAVFVLAAGAGKTLGLMRARSKRDRLVDDLYVRVAGRELNTVAG